MEYATLYFCQQPALTRFALRRYYQIECLCMKSDSVQVNSCFRLLHTIQLKVHMTQETVVPADSAFDPASCFESDLIDQILKGHRISKTDIRRLHGGNWDLDAVFQEIEMRYANSYHYYGIRKLHRTQVLDSETFHLCVQYMVEFLRLTPWQDQLRLWQEKLETSGNEEARENLRRVGDDLAPPRPPGNRIQIDKRAVYYRYNLTVGIIRRYKNAYKAFKPGPIRNSKHRANDLLQLAALSAQAELPDLSDLERQAAQAVFDDAVTKAGANAHVIEPIFAQCDPAWLNRAPREQTLTLLSEHDWPGVGRIAETTIRNILREFKDDSLP